MLSYIAYSVSFTFGLSCCTERKCVPFLLNKDDVTPTKKDSCNFTLAHVTPGQRLLSTSSSPRSFTTEHVEHHDPRTCLLHPLARLRPGLHHIQLPPADQLPDEVSFLAGGVVPGQEEHHRAHSLHIRRRPPERLRNVRKRALAVPKLLLGNSGRATALKMKTMVTSTGTVKQVEHICRWTLKALTECCVKKKATQCCL
uniref:Secreted protein n=1 Tax=Steinernema glaseri TaxID=37863 RepID=A0A1I8A1A9_9BILA